MKNRIVENFSNWNKLNEYKEEFKNLTIDQIVVDDYESSEEPSELSIIKEVEKLIGDTILFTPNPEFHRNINSLEDVYYYLIDFKNNPNASYQLYYTRMHNPENFDPGFSFDTEDGDSIMEPEGLDPYYISSHIKKLPFFNSNES
jgi:hypothetical protein